MSLTVSERTIYPQVLKLASGVSKGELSAIGAKECLRACIEEEKCFFEQLPDIFSVPQETIILNLSLAMCALDGMRPEGKGDFRQWFPEMIQLLRHFRRIDRSRSLANRLDGEELAYFFLWTITQAIILAGAEDMLLAWQAECETKTKVAELEEHLNEARQLVAKRTREAQQHRRKR